MNDSVEAATASGGSHSLAGKISRLFFAPFRGGGEKASTEPGKNSQRGKDVLAEGIAACRSAFGIVAIFSIAVNILLLTVPLYLLQISDRVLASRSGDTLIMLTIVAAGALIVLALLDLLRRYVLTRAGMKLEAELGAPLLASSLQQSATSANKDIQGLRDLAQMRTFVSGPLLPLLFDLPTVPLYIAVVALIHPGLGLIALVGALVLFAIAVANQMLTAKPMALLGGHSMAALARAQAQARNAEVIHAMGMLASCVRLWGVENARALKAQADANDRNALMTGLSKFLRMGIQISILGWGAHLALQGELTAGMMIAASIIAGRALAPIEGAIEGWRSTINARNAYHRVQAILETSRNQIEQLELPKPDGAISVENLIYMVPGRRQPIVSQISFNLEPGESLAIIGATGAGKSTLARLMIGALEPTAGCVRLSGMDVRNWDRGQFGENVGYLPQDVELFPGTIAENIARNRQEVPAEEIVHASKLAGVHSLISQFPEGYQTRIELDGSPLSGGQRQRIGLARALFGNPCFVVLDEPNSSLDGEGEAALSEALKAARQQGATVVTVTQRPAVLQLADKVMLLQGGQIEGFGPRAEMLTRLVHAQKAHKVAGAKPANEQTASTAS